MLEKLPHNEVIKLDEKRKKKNNCKEPQIVSVHCNMVSVFLLCILSIYYLAFQTSGRGLSSSLREKFYSHPIHSTYYNSYWKPLRENYKNKYGGSGDEYYFDQLIDHFNAYNSNYTFKQRYFINDTFWDSSNNGPYLFIAGGEGENDGFSSSYGIVANLAENLKGLMVTAEHRFYGKSRPFGNYNQSSYKLNSNNLGLLQVEQSLADYVELMEYLQTNNNSNYKCELCPIVVFGGSYPGELAVWLRIKYPFVFDVALGASAPIFYTSNNIVNAYEYYQIVTNATRKLNPKCVDLVNLGFQQLQNASNSDITSKLNLYFYIFIKRKVHSK